MTDTIISLTKITKNYKNLHVLKNLDLTVTSGQILGLIGPSGAGKTTLIKIILGMQKADSGKITVFNQKMPNRLLLNKIGYMAQSDALYDSLSAKENLQFFGEMKGIKKAELTKEIARIAQVVNLTSYLNMRVKNFSGGMKRRLSLAIALLNKPDLLILDEPTVGIDPALRIQIWRELENIRDSGQTILLTTHMMQEAELVDRDALLIDGKIKTFDTPANLKKQYQVPTIEDVFLKAEGVKL